MTFTTASTIICVMLWIIVFAVMVYNREDRIRFYFASKKVQMAQLQEAWDEQERLDNAFLWLSGRATEYLKEKDYLQEQLHRVARERDNERKLRLEAERWRDDGLVDIWEDISGRWESLFHRMTAERDAAQDALLDYHLDKREKDEEGRAADRRVAERCWLEPLANEEE